MLVLIALLAALLHSPVQMGLWPLRSLEVAIFWGLAADFMWIDWVHARAATQQANADAAVGHAKDSGERWKDVVELAEALRGLGLSEPWTQSRAAEWWRLHRPVEESDATFRPVRTS